MKNVVQDLTSAGLLGVWGKWMKHAKYIYNIQDFNPEQVLAVGYTKSKLITDAMMWFDKFSCKRSDLVITVGRDLVETVENRFKDKKVPKTVISSLRFYYTALIRRVTLYLLVIILAECRFVNIEQILS